MVDGQLQAIGFTDRNLKLPEIESIKVYSPENAKRYFSSRFEGGLVVNKTHKTKTLQSGFKINVVEVKIASDGGWKILSDTVLAHSMDEFRAYPASSKHNPVIYMIDNRLENEYTNRKTINFRWCCLLGNHFRTKEVLLFQLERKEKIKWIPSRLKRDLIISPIIMEI